MAELLSDNMYECNKELKKSFLTELLKWDVNNITDNLAILIDKKLDLFSSTINNK